jgi:FKBP-type peptidyl-prolyl cis-trans isomerase FklB
MKSHWIAAIGIGSLVCVSLVAQNGGKDAVKPGDNAELKSLKDRASYSIGLNMGKNMKQQGVEIDIKLLARGLEDGLTGGKALMTDVECRTCMMEFQKEMTSKQADRNKGAGERNKKEGEAFLAENKKKPDVTTLPSGLQYKVITMGTGPKPTATDTVTTHYRGTLIDGKQFDSSYDRGEPTSFGVSQVIKGWTEALQLMPVGSKWQLFIPSELAYGERGAGADIGPNATLIFDIELIKIGE